MSGIMVLAGLCLVNFLQIRTHLPAAWTFHLTGTLVMKAPWFRRLAKSLLGDLMLVAAH